MAIVAIFAQNRKTIAFVNKQTAKLEFLFALDKQVFPKLDAILESVSSIGTNECFSFARAQHVKPAGLRGKCSRKLPLAFSGLFNLWPLSVFRGGGRVEERAAACWPVVTR